MPDPDPRTDSADLLDLALDAVRQAMRVCDYVQSRRASFGPGGGAMTKSDRSPVTIADFASQAIVAGILREALGDIRLVGEESAGYLREPQHAEHLSAVLRALAEADVWPDASAAEVLDAIDLGVAEPDHTADAGFWTLDPIDGTKGFVRGDQYCVALAFIRRGVVELGVLGCPRLGPRSLAEPPAPAPAGCAPGTLFSAVRGSGAMMHYDPPNNPDATIETDIAHPGVAFARPVVVAESVESSHTRQDVSQSLVARAWPAGVAPPVRIDSQCKYAVVARGEADIYLRIPRANYTERIWDHAAGALLLTESGCTVTDLDNRPLDFALGRGLDNNRGIVGAPAEVHARLIEAARRLA